MSQVSASYQQITTANGCCGYIEVGHGQPLIMLVGYSGNLLHWNSELIGKLAQHFRVILPDNRKVGLSDSTNPETMHGMALDVADFMDALGLDSVYLLGWSMGGIIVQEFLLQFASRCLGAALIASEPQISYTTSELHQLVNNLLTNPGSAARAALGELFYSEAPSIEFRKYLAKVVLRIQHYVYPFNVVAQRLHDKIVADWTGMNEEQLAAIKIPVLLLAARNDRVIPYAASQYLFEHLPATKLCLYSHGGHFFLNYYPQELAGDIIAFLAKKT